jgi:hypothetical protein
MTDVQVTLSLPVLKVGFNPESGSTVIKHLQLMLNQRGGFLILTEGRVWPIHRSVCQALPAE